MNQSALKTFAQNARNKLRQLIGTRLDYVLTADTAELRQQAAQVSELLAALKAEGRDPLIERVAYTWFNRLTALRFMDANGYHPFSARVVTPATANETLPEVLQQARAGALDAILRASIANPRLFDELLAGRIPVDHPEAQVFKLLLLAACNYYHRLMPFLFEQLGDATELLLPEDLLTEHSIVADFREDLADDDCREVEVLGWLYQFYISEKKDAVMARKSAVPTEDIPAVTQLFTPHWIVRYLVENSLGRLWLLNRPRSGLREHMPYYIEGEAETEHLKITKPEDIRICDPAIGSGHMFTYAFDLLHRIYEEEGYDAPEIPGLILRHNLHGLEICDRATALAAFALCMKARSRDRRFFRRLEKDSAEVPRPHIIELRNVRFDESELRDYIASLKLDAFFEKAARQWIEEGQLLDRARLFNSSKPAGCLLRLLESQGEILSGVRQFGLEEKAEKVFHRFFEEGRTLNELDGHTFEGLAAAAFRTFVNSGEILSCNELALGDLAKQVYFHLFQQFEEAKNFGSLIQPCLDERAITDARRAIEAKDLGGQLFLRETHLKVLRVLEQAEALTQRYHVVVANPPYMGSGQMDARTKAWAEANFPRSKSDLYSMFIERSRELVLSDGFAALVTMESWMFLSSFHALRLGVLNEQTLHGMIHMPYLGKGGTSMGINFGTAAVIWKMTKPSGRKAQFFCLRYYETDEVGHPLQFPPCNERTAHTDPALFLKVQNAPFAYWLKNFDVFDWPRLAVSWKSGGRLKTHDGPRFIRFCWETSQSSTRWRRLVKGGDFKKHSGNEEYLVDWCETAVAYYQDHGGLYPNEFRNREGICWSKITSAISSFRIKAPDCEYDSASPTIFNHEYRCDFVLLAFLNSFVARHFLQAVNPTLNTQLVDVLGLPFKDLGVAESERIRESEMNAVAAARADWDNFETSWDFRDQPLLRPAMKCATLEASWRNWEAQSTAAIRRMQELETENNRLFIAAYGLDGELQPEVPTEQITLARAEARRDMAAFLSYAVGCMMGRYSPDHPGLILANAGDSLREFLEKVGKPLAELTFAPDEDGIIPVLDGEWFEDDIVARIRDFLRATFGEAKLAENMRFIEVSLGKELRKYFASQFYKDHLQTYKKRPIYWMFSSPEGSFQALIYLHRYTRDTVNLLLNDYVREFIGKLEEKHRQLTAVTLNESARPGDRTKAAKELGKIAKMQKELQAWERDILLPLAQQRLELDLDDGVKVNYVKFKGAVVNIPGLDKGDED